MKNILKQLAEENQAREKVEIVVAQAVINHLSTKDVRRNFLKKTALVE